MFPIFICEDQKEYLDRIIKCINKHIEIARMNAKIIIASHDPSKIIQYLKDNNVSGLYFLDLNLENSLDGFNLAKEIRKYDPRAAIAIITNDRDSASLMFEYVINILDYITKDYKNIANRIANCLNNAYEAHMARLSQSNEKLEIKLSQDIVARGGERLFKGGTTLINFEDIFYIESAPGKAHQINIHCVNSYYTTRWDLAKAQKALDARFVRCHKSYVVNVEKISGYFYDKGLIILSNDIKIGMGHAYIKNVQAGLKFLSKRI